MSDIISDISAMRFPASQGKFAPKLTYEQRCEVLALHHLGVPRNVLVESYGIDRRTIAHIISKNSIHYRNVRAKFAELGKDAFMQKYLNEGVKARIAGAIKKIETPLPAAPNKNASKFEGVHVVQNAFMTTAHRIIIRWCEAGIDTPVAGWYYRDADGAEPNRWFSNGEESMMNSKACLEAVRENLTDV